MTLLADVGIPMLSLEWPLMIGALVPVIIVEALLIRRWIPLTYRSVFIGTTKANIVATFAGVPLAWFMMFVIEIVTLLPLGFAAYKWHWHFLESPFVQIIAFPLSVAWLGPAAGNAGYWIVPLAAAILLIPSFYISVWLETKTWRRSWPDVDLVALSQAVRFANIASYGTLFVLACGWAAVEYYIHGH